MSDPLRILINGGPNVGKTRAIVETFPRPLHVVNAPGEKGGGWVARLAEPDLTVAVPADPLAPAAKILDSIEKTILDTVKAGQVQTIAFEGLHKLMDYIMDLVTDGEYFKGLKPDWPMYSLCYHRANRFLDRILVNTTPVIVVTSWAKEKASRKKQAGERQEDIPLAVGPDLLGEYSRKVLGEFDVVLHQALHKTDRTDKEGKRIYESRWQTRPNERVVGCGIKGPRALVEAIPLYIPADFQTLQTYLKGPQ